MSRPIRMGSAAAVVSGGILLSRILGLVRESLLAGLIGVNADGDLYRYAFVVPDFLSYLLAGAYLTITLIPILSRHVEDDDEEGANRAFTSVFRFVGGGIVALTLLMWTLAPLIVDLAFPGVPELHDRLVDLTRIALPAQIFLVLGALLMAAQYTHRRFLIPTMAPIVYNLGIIVGGLVGQAAGGASAESFLWGAVAGSAVGNFALQWWGARRTGVRLVPTRGHSAVGEYLVLALPLMLGQSVAVLDEQFVRWFGQIGVEGTASALSFARQLNMVPVGVIAQAAGVAAYPYLARLAAAGDHDELNTTTERAARNTVFIASMATALLVVLARPAVDLIYSYGEFTDADATLVARLLVLYAFSIPAWGLHQLIARYFYARRRMWVPVIVGTVATVVAVPTWLGLYELAGVEGFAIASTLVMAGYALALLLIWGREAGWDGLRRTLPSFARGAISAGLAGVVAFPLVGALGDRIGAGVGPTLITLVVGALTTMAVFAVVAGFLKSPELGAIGARIRHRLG